MFSILCNTATITGCSQKEYVHLATGQLCGEFRRALLDGRSDFDCDASVSKLEGSLLARLVVVSNRGLGSLRATPRSAREGWKLHCGRPSGKPGGYGSVGAATSVKPIS